MFFTFCQLPRLRITAKLTDFDLSILDKNKERVLDG